MHVVFRMVVNVMMMVTVFDAVLVGVVVVHVATAAILCLSVAVNAGTTAATTTGSGTNMAAYTTHSTTCTVAYKDGVFLVRSVDCFVFHMTIRLTCSSNSSFLRRRKRFTLTVTT